MDLSDVTKRKLCADSKTTVDYQCSGGLENSKRVVEINGDISTADTNSAGHLNQTEGGKIILRFIWIVKSA